MNTLYTIILVIFLAWFALSMFFYIKEVWNNRNKSEPMVNG